MADIFLSYARGDQPRVEALASALNETGYSIWWDKQIEGGRHFAKDIEKEISAAKAVIVVWSESSVESNWVLDEASFGRDEGKLVPVSFDGTMPPFGFRQIQSIDFSAWPKDSSAFDALQRSLEITFGREPASSEAIGTSAKGPVGSTGLSRRNLVLGGIGLAGGAAALASWQVGWFGPSPARTMSMAVLRFENLTGDDGSWFSDGLSNELRQVLSRNPLLRVSAPTSSTVTTEKDDFALGRALGVGNILRGTVQRAGETVRIFAELVEIADGFVKWSESYDREFSDVLSVQSEIADTVAFALVAQIASEEEARNSLDQQKAIGGTENFEAYRAYLHGMAYFDLSSGTRSDRSALERFDEAIALDPGFAKAHSMRALALAAVAGAGNDVAEIDRFYASSITAARKAIELEPLLAQAYVALGFSQAYGNLDMAGAYPNVRKAHELAPGDPGIIGNVAMIYAYGEDHRVAKQLAAQMRELDPLNPRTFRTAGFIALLGRNFGATIEHMRQALDLNAKLASANYGTGIAHLALGDFAAAKSSFEAEPVPIFGLTGLAIAEQALGDREAAENALASMVAEYGDACLYQQAQVQAQWGRKSESVELLSRALEKRDPGMLFARNDVLLDPVRPEPGFDKVILPLKR